MTRKAKYNWAEIDKYLGELTDREVSDKFKMSIKIISNRRIRKGIPVIRKWSKYGHLLGTMPDKDLALITKMTQNAVTVQRIRRGIERFGSNPESIVEAVFCATLKESFERQVSTELGRIDILTPSTIYECKYILRLCEMHKAIGQLICYGSIFPDRQRGIVCAEIRITDSARAFLAGYGITLIQIECEI